MTTQWPTFTDDAMDTLIKLSRYYGSRSDIVLAGGGNTSAKIDGSLFVKASGHALATIDESGFVELERGPLLDLLDADVPSDVNAREAMYKRVSLAARVHPEQNQRPSVECLLHNLIPATYVVHSHATLVNMVTSCTDGEALTAELFGDDALWVEFVDPGITLARVLRDRLAEYKTKTGRDMPDAILMQSHGLIIAGETPEEIQTRTDKMLAAIEAKVGPAEDRYWTADGKLFDGEEARELINFCGPLLRGLLAEGEDLPIVTYTDSDTVRRLVGCGEFAEIVGGGPMNPDQIVYCKAFPLTVSLNGTRDRDGLLDILRASVDGYVSERGFKPKVILIESLGMFTAAPDYASAATTSEVYSDAIDVMAGASKLGGIRYMPKRDTDFIENWEVESYRRKIAAASSKGRSEGKVAIVTGAAQGFGLEIAQDFAAQGGHVALVDIQVEQARQAASEITGKTKRGRALGLAMNVTDRESIAEAIHLAVRAYGGFDVLISNAGVLRAESVLTQSEKDFRFVTDVNYVGYFLVTQAAGPVLAAQQAAKPDYMSDIIQINSKSGLVGSNRNGAYAGSKFGGIGLTQSFALELVDYGIKVNSICPGNFYDGPLWSDPDNGLFVQYLQAGKVPGAKTIADVRKAYEAKSPIHRGCTTPDVMKAVYYLMEQKYETGQAVPVTGGQVMLS